MTRHIVLLQSIARMHGSHKLSFVVASFPFRIALAFSGSLGSKDAFGPILSINTSIFMVYAYFFICGEPNVIMVAAKFSHMVLLYPDG